MVLCTILCIFALSDSDRNKILMKVFYDSQAFDMQTHGGVSRYIYEIYRNRTAEVEAELGVIESDNVYLQQLGIPSEDYTYNHFICGADFPLKRMLYKAYYNCKYGHAQQWDHTPKLNQLLSESIIKKGDFDVFHATYFDGYFLEALGNRPFVLTVHDMISELFPNFYNERHPLVTGKQLLIPKAAHIIAVSEATKKDLMRLMNVPEEKITVIYHGVNESSYVPSAKSPFDFEYILYVGERHLYKNFFNFCRSVFPILKRHQDLNVVCTGREFNEKEQTFLKENMVTDRFKHIFFRTDQERYDLYHHALTFVYPSAYEGFGMPILEAFKAGCTVMLNHASCFPEIAGNAAIYFNITDGASDFEEQFENVYRMNAKEREEQLLKQEQRLKLFSWKKSAQQHTQVYQKLC